MPGRADIPEQEQHKRPDQIMKNEKTQDRPLVDLSSRDTNLAFAGGKPSLEPNTQEQMKPDILSFGSSDHLYASNTFLPRPKVPDGWDHLSFVKTQHLQQRAGESEKALHERLRPYAVSSLTSLDKPTQIDTESWYTFDASKITGIKDAVVVSTSTCKHETPYRMLVGIRDSNDWETKTGPNNYTYKLRPLGRELTEAERNAIYNKM